MQHLLGKREDIKSFFLFFIFKIVNIYLKRLFIKSTQCKSTTSRERERERERERGGYQQELALPMVLDADEIIVSPARIFIYLRRVRLATI